MVRKMVCGVVLLCSLIVLAGTTAWAGYTSEEIDMLTGPATGISYSALVAGLKPGDGELVNAIDNKNGTYTFEGKNYQVESNWGEHCLTGYAATGNCTASGKMPTIYHTVSGPKAMLGKICLVRGKYLQNGKTGPVNTYDGIYVFEDTGGKAVEYGIPTTMNVPVVDIYRETLDAARAVTANGSIVADIYILSEVK